MYALKLALMLSVDELAALQVRCVEDRQTDGQTDVQSCVC